MELIVTLTDIKNIEKLNKINVKNIIVTSIEFGDRANKFFSLDEIENVISKTNMYDINVYLNMNVMVHEFELADLDNYLSKVQNLDLKGIYFNDLAILELSKKYNLLNKMIYNPDTLMTNSRDINYYLDYGIKSVVISKELTLDEILLIQNNIPNKLDLVIHGRLSMSYSRRMYIKNYLKHINNNYDYSKSNKLTLIEATRDKKMPIMENRHGSSLFTDYTLCSFDELLQLNKLNRLIVDDIFLDFEEVEYSVKQYNKVLNNDDSKEMLAQIREKYPESNYDSGYMYRKTNLVK
jgi:putative protease